MTTIDVLAALHHPVRRRIYEFLYLQGASQVGTLARELEQQVGSISHHLRMLERAGMVERAPELAADGRTSWWRVAATGLSWSVEDFADRPADQQRARAAERLNLEHQVSRYLEWQRARGSYDVAWRRAAFSNDALARATPEELGRLGDMLAETVRTWRDSIDTEDGQEREPVFVFQHGMPMRTGARR